MAREKRLFFRRCHVCDRVTENAGPILYCEHCGKPVAPFCYFNEQDVAVVSENKERPRYKNDQVIPIVGLSAYWGIF